MRLLGVEEDAYGRFVGVVRDVDIRVTVVTESGGGEFASPTTRTVLSAALPGWPDTTGLLLKAINRSAPNGGRALPSAVNFRRLPLIRRRYVHFGDPAWDDAFIVKGDDHETIGRELNQTRRDALRTAARRVRGRGRIERGGYMGWQYHYEVKDGRLMTDFSDVFTDASVIAEEMDRLVDLAAVLTD